MAPNGLIRRRCAATRDNGFGLLFNWNLLGDGEHEVVALVDGVELDRATVTVTTLGAEFLRDVTGMCEVEDFPTRDETVTLAWQQTQQNFVIVDGPAPAGTTNRAGRAGVGYLENPGPHSFQSGIGVISGWVCEGAEVIIELNGEPQPAAYGTERLDTESKPVGTRTTALASCSTGTCWARASMTVVAVRGRRGTGPGHGAGDNRRGRSRGGVSAGGNGRMYSRGLPHARRDGHAGVATE